MREVRGMSVDAPDSWWGELRRFACLEFALSGVSHMLVVGSEVDKMAIIGQVPAGRCKSGVGREGGTRFCEGIMTRVNRPGNLFYHS
jgi:hypothetical protein